MRDKFGEYLRPSETEIKNAWKSGLFVFDTSVLLGMYSLSVTARKKLFATLKLLGDRAWIPNQVALEYYRNRNRVICERMDRVRKIISDLNKLQETVSSELHFRDKDRSYSNVINKVNKALKEYESWLKNDPIERELHNIFHGKVGDGFSHEKLTEIYKEGEGRYDKKIPPGYKDSNKDHGDRLGTAKFGDLVVWKQTMERGCDAKCPLLFVTDDTKEDWWFQIGTTTLGPRPELVKEMRSSANIQFYIYRASRFMEQAGTYLNVSDSKIVIDELKKRNTKNALVISEGSPALGGEIAESQALIGTDESIGPNLVDPPKL